MIISHGTDAAESIPDNDWITCMQRTLLNQYGSNRTLTLIQTCFDHRTNRFLIRVSFEFEHIGFK